MRNLFDATRVATVTLDSTLAIRGFTPAMKALFNLLPSDRGRPFGDMAGTLDTGPILEDARLALRGTEPQERRVSSRDGHRHYLLRVLPYRTMDGTVDGALAALVDVTQLVEAVEAREHQRLLVGELNHRVRNMLQVVIGLARQTLREAPSPDAFGQMLIGRMQALSKAYQLISQEEWGDVELRDLVMDQLGPHLPHPRRAAADGPRILLHPPAAVALGLVLHELATNAMKHGALRTETGLVTVRWEVRGAPERPVLALNWLEQGGPAVTMPTRRGFGSALIKTQVERALRGQLEVDYPVEGLRAVITLPVDAEQLCIGAG